MLSHVRPTSRRSYDVAIVGGGPAGASAALCLAKQGVRVAVVEKASLPRYKTCGGGVVRRAIRLLPVDVREAVERDCYSVELNLRDADLHFSTKRKDPIISMTMREKLDFLLVSAAKDAGAEVRSSCEVLNVVTHADGVELVTCKGSLLARFVVAADGATGVVARRAGPSDTRYLIPALECEVFVGDDLLTRFSQTARFDFGVVPRGYAWVFPKKEHLSIGVLTMRRGPINLNEMFDRYLELLGIHTALRLERHGSLVPVSPSKGTLAKGRVLFAGDAAGLADPVTGEGITFAIQSGQIAAKALLDGNFDEEGVRHAYDSEIAWKLLPELRLAKVLATMIYDHPKLRTLLFWQYGQRLSDAVTDVLMGERTYREILRDPLNYLKLLRVWGQAPREGLQGKAEKPK